MPPVTDDVEIREYREEDEASCLELRNRVFPPISVDDWRHGSTAAVAYLEGRLVGVIPFVLRNYALRQDLSVVSAVANSVAVSEALRGRGIGTRMMSAAAGFLQDRADTMMVYTGDEPAGRQYRFYRATGHVDVAYPVIYRLRAAGAPPAGFRAEVSSVELIDKLEDELLAVFGMCWRDYGGHVRRERGFYRRALSSHIFVEVPYDGMSLISLSERERLSAYAIVGVREAQATVLEWAWASPGAESALVSALHRFGLSHRAEVAVWSCRVPALPFGSPDAEWQRDGRDAVVVGQVLRPDRIWARMGTHDTGSPLPTLSMWTPKRQLVLNADGKGLVSLEMKEWQFHQMLFCRGSLENDVRLQRITAGAGTWEEIGQLNRIFRSAPWEYHHLDYI